MNTLTTLQEELQTEKLQRQLLVSGFMTQTTQHKAKVKELEQKLAQAKVELEIQRQRDESLNKEKKTVGSLASTTQINQAETHLYVHLPPMLDMPDFQGTSHHEEEQQGPVPGALDVRGNLEQNIEDMPEGPAKEFLLHEKRVMESATLAYLQLEEQAKGFGHDFLPLPLLKHEKILWKEEMRPALPKNNDGGYEGIKLIAEQAQALIEDHLKWQKKWLQDKPNDLTNFHNTPKALQIDPTYCPVPRRRTWPEFQRQKGSVLESAGLFAKVDPYGDVFPPHVSAFALLANIQRGLRHRVLQNQHSNISPYGEGPKIKVIPCLDPSMQTDVKGRLEPCFMSSVIKKLRAKILDIQSNNKAEVFKNELKEKKSKFLNKRDALIRRDATASTASMIQTKITSLQTRYGTLKGANATAEQLAAMEVQITAMSNAVKLIEGDDKIIDMKIAVESIERDINFLERKLSYSLHYMSFFENMMKQLANGCTLLLIPAFYALEEGRTNRAYFYSDCVACGEPLPATNAIGVYMLPCVHKYHRWSAAEAAHHMSFETSHGSTENALSAKEGNVFDLRIASPGGAEKSWSDCEAACEAANNVGHDSVPSESTVLGATSEEGVEAVLGGNTNAESVFLAEFVKRFKSNKHTATRLHLEKVRYVTN
ncbi:hypothetical protein L7F22_029563 [Adiantum nelumboides]|nr:hypothetical protein [Adiantum nelumboides]